MTHSHRTRNKCVRHEKDVDENYRWLESTEYKIVNCSVQEQQMQCTIRSAISNELPCLSCSLHTNPTQRYMVWLGARLSVCDAYGKCYAAAVACVRIVWMDSSFVEKTVYFLLAYRSITHAVRIQRDCSVVVHPSTVLCEAGKEKQWNCVHTKRSAWRQFSLALARATEEEKKLMFCRFSFSHSSLTGCWPFKLHQWLLLLLS